jgi:hypothetical protein
MPRRGGDEVTPAERVLCELQRRLLDALVLAEALAEFDATSRFARFSRWTATSLGFGGAGVALFSDELRRLGLADAQPCHELLRRGAAELVEPRPTGLFDGHPGYGLVVSVVNGYRTFRRQLDSLLTPDIIRHTDKVGFAPATSTADYDLVSGLAGHGAYLLTGSPNAVAVVVDACDRLLRPGLANLVVGVGSDDGFPFGTTGFLDCGMAHGVAGLIALRALAGPGGGLEAATEWLIGQQIRAGGTLRWPRRVLLDAAGRPHGHTPPAGSGWCYGTAGIARSIWLSGRATGRADHCAVAIEALHAVMAEPTPADPTLCHGLAGLLLIALEFARDTGSAEIGAYAQGLVPKILDHHEPQSTLGFRAREPDGRQVANPGLLNGSVGIGLALSAALSPQRPLWTRALLLN